MSAGSSAARLAETTGSGPEGSGDCCLAPEPDFDPTSHLLHELNQPLTGLQCCLELATVGSRSPQQYLLAIHNGLDLVGRMRMLVEALREINDIAHSRPAQESLLQPEPLHLQALVRSTVEDLRPVAEARFVGITLEGEFVSQSCAAPVESARVLFRILESALSLAAERSVLRIQPGPQSRATITLGWTEDVITSERSSLSLPQLGLLVARVAWQHAGGGWKMHLAQASRTLILSLPQTTDHQPPQPACGDRS